MKHHEYGMSRWPALFDCGCFEGAESGKYAAAGTSKHEQFAGYLRAIIDVKAIEVPEDIHSRGALIAAQQIADTVNDIGGDVGKIKIEERVEIVSETLNGIYGTADAFYVDDDARTIYVWDFKTFYNPGRDYVPQLVGYAWAIQSMLLAGTASLYNVVVGTLYGDAPHKNYSLRLGTEDCQRIVKNMGKVIDAAAAGTAKPTQCAWCELCKHKSACPAFRAVAEAVTTTPDLASAVENWGTLAVTRKAQLMVLAETVCKWADAVREAAKADLLAGGEIADAENGIKYVLRNTSGRKTPRTLDAWKMLVARGVDPEAIKAKLTISASAVKDVLKAAGIKGKAADALVAEVSDVGAGSTQMVRG